MYTSIKIYVTAYINGSCIQSPLLVITRNWSYARLKKNYSDSAGEATAFTSVVTNTTGGIATLSLSNTQTDALKAGRHVYDVELSNVDSSSGNTIIERILEGRVQITPSVTKWGNSVR